MEQTEFQKKVEEIKSRIDSRTTIHMDRVPEKTKTEFMKIAEEEFAKDYGMTLKWLIDFRKGLLTTTNQQLKEEIQDVEQELSAKIDLLADELRKIKEEISEKKERRMNDRRIIK